MRSIFARLAVLENHAVEEVRRREELERRMRNVVRPGRVTQVDPAKNLVKIAWAQDEDGKDLESPWIPWVERAGAIRTWTPPAAGEQVLMFSPSGDISTHSWVMPGGFTDQFGQPHDKAAEHKLVVGNAEILAKDGEVHIKVGNSRVVITADEIVTYGKTRLNDGQRKVHYVGGVDTDGDAAVDGADAVLV